MSYMAPEQWGIGVAIDHRADIWAVGIMLFKMLTGKHPLDPLKGHQLMVTGMLDKPMPTLHSKAPEIPIPLAQIVDKCLMKRKEDRFPDAVTLLRALEPFLPGRYTQEIKIDESPYAGLSSFQEADAARFFGRRQEIAAVVNRIRERPLLGIGLQAEHDSADARRDAQFEGDRDAEERRQLVERDEVFLARRARGQRRRGRDRGDAARRVPAGTPGVIAPRRPRRRRGPPADRRRPVTTDLAMALRVVAEHRAALARIADAVQVANDRMAAAKAEQVAAQERMNELAMQKREATRQLHAALRAQRVPAELHLFEHGGHGFGLRKAAGLGEPAGEAWREAYDLVSAWDGKAMFTFREPITGDEADKQVVKDVIALISDMRDAMPKLPALAKPADRVAWAIDYMNANKGAK